jgi:recombination protein RecA
MKDSIEKSLNELFAMNPFSETTYYPIKNKVLNGLLGGNGLPKGSVIQIAAGSGTGKSTIVLRDICKDLLEQGVSIGYIDADRGINTSLLTSTGVIDYLVTDMNSAKTKLDNNEPIFLTFQESSFSGVNKLIQLFLKLGIYTIVIDTIAILDSGMYVGDDAYNIENRRVGGDAGALRQLMKNINNLASKYTDKNNKVNFILLNHTAKEIGGFSFGPPKETPKGGDAPIQYSDIIIQLYKYSSKSETLNDKPIGQKVYAELVKSRHTTGKVKTPFFIRYGAGISMILTYKEILEEGKMITSKGRTYTISLPNGKELTYVNKDNLLKCIIDNYDVIDSCFTSSKWMIDISNESDILNVEYEETIDTSKLPQELQHLKVERVQKNFYYFMRGVDLSGQNYYMYYDIETKRLVREYDSMKENIPVKNVDKAMNEVKEYLKELKEENEKETLEETLAKNALK